MGRHAREMYGRFEQMIGECGEYRIAPAKSRIAFLGRVRFAGITRLSEKGMTCSFSLPYRLNSNRFAKVEEVVPGWWVHRLRITDVGQLRPSGVPGAAATVARLTAGRQIGEASGWRPCILDKNIGFLESRDSTNRSLLLGWARPVHFSQAAQLLEVSLT